jgi:hypothetical protein
MNYELDLSRLTIDQMKDIIKIINPSCGEDKFEPTCNLCDACMKECIERGIFPLPIASCG